MTPWDEVPAARGTARSPLSSRYASVDPDTFELPLDIRHEGGPSHAVNVDTFELPADLGSEGGADLPPPSVKTLRTRTRNR
jgi:hypothetical protein